MRSIPTITKNLLIINVLAWLISYVLETQGVSLNSMLGLHFFMASKFQVYQLFTYMFLHGGLQHLFFNMFALWMFGCVVEHTWGAKKFLFYYISCGVGAGLIQEIAQFVRYSMDNLGSYQQVLIEGTGVMPVDLYLNLWTTRGASGAIYGILLAFGMLYPENRIFIFPFPVPIKAKWFVVIYAAIELFMAMTTSGDGVAHVAHLGGMLFGFMMIKYWNNKRFYTEIKDDKKKYHNPNMHVHHTDGEKNRDWDFNLQKKKKQTEIDAILDKIRRSGYESLTAQEKQKLFDASNK